MYTYTGGLVGCALSQHVRLSECFREILIADGTPPFA
jgi:hypothetical protein